jgi:hypothetical protein
LIQGQDDYRQPKADLPFEQSHDASADVVLDAELISGDEVGSIVECTKRHHSDLLVLAMRKHKLLMGNTTRKSSNVPHVRCWE